MARRQAAEGRAAEARQAAALAREAWPVEWTCAVATAIFFLAFALSGHILPRFFSSQCTHQQGMCTPGDCECTLPRVRRELLTQDAVPCFQCVEEFCPAVPEGDPSCSPTPCECEDPSWPRQNVGSPEAACWQCVHPPLDLTLRPGLPGNCLAPPERREAAGRLRVSSWNSSDCITFHYNGATLADKRDNRSCLAWIPFGAYWGLVPCGEGPPELELARFRQQVLEPPEREPEEEFDQEWKSEAWEGQAGMVEELFCTGAGDEFCVEPSEYMCTTDPTQCSVGHCRCEDPDMVKRELQTINGTACFTCVRPAVACPVSADQCLPSCECARPGYVKVQHPGGPCFSCRPAPAGTSWLLSAAIFLVCICAGVCIGWSLKKLLVPGPAAGKRGRRRAPGGGTWSERWAEKLEDGFEAVTAFFADRPATAISWAFRRVGRAANRVSDEVEQVFEPVLCFLESVQERTCAVCKAAWIAFKAEKPTGEREPRRRERHAAKASRAPAVQAAAQGASSPSKASAPRKAEPSAEPPSQLASEQAEEKSEVADAAEIKPSPFLKAFAQIASAEEAKLEELDWDPLNVSGRSKNSISPAVTIPQEWMMRLVPAAEAAARAKQRAAPPAADAAVLPTQRRALKRLQQRREAAAAAAAAAPTATAAEETAIDESWIDELEESSKREREAKEAKAAQKKERKNAMKSRRGKQGVDAEAAANTSAGEAHGEAAAAAGKADGAEVAGCAEAEATTEAQHEEAEEEEEEAEEDEEEEEAAAAGQEDANEVNSVQSGDFAGGSGALAREVAVGSTGGEAKVPKPQTSRHVEDLLRMVGAGAPGSGPEGGAVQGDLLFSEAMHGLFLLAAEGSGNLEQAAQPAAAGADGGAGTAPNADADAAGTAATAGSASRGVKAGGTGTSGKGKGQPTHRGQQEQRSHVGESSQAALATAPSTVGGADAGAGDAAAKREAPAKAEKGKEKKTPAPDKPSQREPERQPEEQQPAPRLATEERPQRERPQPQAERRVPGAAEPRQRQVQGPSERRQPPPQQQQQPPAQRKAPTQAPWARKPEQAKPEPPSPDPRPKAEEGAQAEPKEEAGRKASTSEAEPKQEAAGMASKLEAQRREELGRMEGKPEAEDVAGAKREEARSSPPLGASKPLAADAPDFVPFAMMQPPAEDMMAHNRTDGRRGRGGRQGKKGGEHKADSGFGGADEQGEQSLPITTVMISGIPSHHSAESFRQQLDSWGLLGTYNFFYMPAESYMGSGYAFVNFIDPTFASLCTMLFQQYQFEGTVAPFHIQGLENNIAHWNQFTNPEDALNAPLIIPTPTPSQWAVNGVNTMLNSKFSPQIREQFHKTKLCVFHKKNKCALGSSCPFAHTREELQPVPDLAKTKLCYNFFRRRCSDGQCKFAHGYQELRATNNIYKTELCRWWSYGGCKAGSSCRYAHGIEELRRTPYEEGEAAAAMEMEGAPFMSSPEFLQKMEGMNAEAAASCVDGGMQAYMAYMEAMSASAPLYEQAEGGYEAYQELQQPLQHGWQEEAQQPEATSRPRAAAAPAPSESLDDGASDMGMSDVSFLFDKPMEKNMMRQQTAPPTSSTSFLASRQGRETSERPDAGNDNIVLRVKGTFMEALQIDMETERVPMHRSWSDGDLAQLSEVMECMEEYS